MAEPLKKKATIANGQSLSAAVELSGGALALVMMPGTWTAAPLTFQVSFDGSTFYNLYNPDGTEYTVPSSGNASASVAYRVPPADFAGARSMKVRSGPSGAAVSQGGARVVSLGVKPV